MDAKQRIIELTSELIAEGENLAKTNRTNARGQVRVSTERSISFAANLQLLRHMAGELLKPWEALIPRPQELGYYYYLQSCVSALVTFKRALEAGDLSRFRDLVFAEAFADLSSQAEYLLSEGYGLAAAVILRAVLEERLRLMCSATGCMPKTKRPGINDFNDALAGAGKYDKTMKLQITALAAIGNAAAHNKPEFQPADVPRLRDGVREVLARFSV